MFLNSRKKILRSSLVKNTSCFTLCILSNLHKLCFFILKSFKYSKINKNCLAKVISIDSRDSGSRRCLHHILATLIDGMANQWPMLEHGSWKSVWGN